jgi:hypothetical protein
MNRNKACLVRCLTDVLSTGLFGQRSLSGRELVIDGHVDVLAHT